jgi:multiple sugar transport system substrate-binding protein
MKQYHLNRRRFLALSAAGVSAAALGAGSARAASDQASWSGTLKLNERATPNKIAYWEQLGARFVQQSPNLTFVVESSDTGTNYDTKLLTGAVSRTVGDLAWLVTTQNFNLFQSKGLVLPVDDMIAADGLDMSPYIKAALDAVTIDGKLYMIPTGFHGGPVSMFYNKKLFDEAGVDHPSPDWEISDFEDAATALTKPDEGQYGVMLPLDNPEALVVLARCWGGDILKNNGTESALGDDATRAMFEWVAGLINDKKVMKHPAELPRLPNAAIDYNGFFGANKAAMWQASPWHANLLRTALGAEAFAETYDIALMPKGPAGRNGQLVVEGYPIFSTTENREAAWAFTKFATTKEEGVARIPNGFVAAPRVDAINDDEMVANDPIYAFYNRALIDNPPAPASVPANNKITEMYAMMKLAFDGIWSGKQSVKDALDAADQQMNDLLAQ